MTDYGEYTQTDPTPTKGSGSGRVKAQTHRDETDSPTRPAGDPERTDRS